MSKNVAVVSGSAGLIGAEAVRFLSAKGFQFVGIDNDMRRQFFGADASTEWSRRELAATILALRSGMDLLEREDPLDFGGHEVCNLDQDCARRLDWR